MGRHSVVSVHGLVGRGFRAPNLNDLGALGLNDLGYEVPAESAIDSGGFIGASDGEGVLVDRPRGRRARVRATDELRVRGRLQLEAALHARAGIRRGAAVDQSSAARSCFRSNALPAALAGVPVDADCARRRPSSNKAWSASRRARSARGEGVRQRRQRAVLRDGRTRSAISSRRDGRSTPTTRTSSATT